MSGCGTSEAIRHRLIPAKTRSWFAKNNQAVGLPPSRSPVYVSDHAAGETRRRPGPRGAERRKPSRGRGAGTDATGKPRVSGRPADRTGILRDRRAVFRTAGLTTRKIFSETRGRDFRIAHRRRLRPAASLRSELGPRPDTERTRVPRGLRLRPRLPRDFLVMTAGGRPPCNPPPRDGFRWLL